MFGTILLCAGRVLNGDMTMGGLTACMMLAGRALQPLQQSASYWLRLPAVQQAQEKIAEINQLESERIRNYPERQPTDLEGEIELKGMSFQFSPDEEKVLDNLNLHVPQRSILGLTGPSKNGSTTLLLYMMGHFRPTEGKITIDGNDLRELSPATLHGKVQYLSRNGAVFRGTILENITSFRGHRQSIALSTANILGLDPLVSPLPQGYETVIDSRTRLPMELVHRISLARVLVRRPRVLLVDKSTASMDSST